MSAAQYWYETNPGMNLYDISEHLRQSLWRYGLGTAWVQATRAEPPYTAEGRWHDVLFSLEWAPQQYVILRMSANEKDIEQAISTVLGFKPLFRYTDGVQQVYEWRQAERAARWNELVQRE